MNLNKPIIMVGTGRCGSTMLHRLLARHDDVGWLSTFNEVFPTQAWLSVFSNLYRTRLPEKLKTRRYFPKPYEAYKFWEHYLPGFRRRDQPQTAADVPRAAIATVRHAVSRILICQGRSRFLVKVTGWSRMAYFDQIFPDALFVILNREHRAVISSMMQADWIDVSSALDAPTWQWGEVPGEYRELWRDLGATPLLSAAVKVQLDLDDIRRNAALFPARCHEMRYEDLIAAPREQLRALAAFCGLEWTERFEEVIEATVFYNAADKWKTHLSEAEGDLVVEFFRRADALRHVTCPR